MCMYQIQHKFLLIVLLHKFKKLSSYYTQNDHELSLLSMHSYSDEKQILLYACYFHLLSKYLYITYLDVFEF